MGGMGAPIGGMGAPMGGMGAPAMGGGGGPSPSTPFNPNKKGPEYYTAMA